MIFPCFDLWFILNDWTLPELDTFWQALDSHDQLFAKQNFHFCGFHFRSKKDEIWKEWVTLTENQLVVATVHWAKTESRVSDCMGTRWTQRGLIDPLLETVAMVFNHKCPHRLPHTHTFQFQVQWLTFSVFKADKCFEKIPEYQNS